jgi:hypothetical protein
MVRFARSLASLSLKASEKRPIDAGDGKKMDRYSDNKAANALSNLF